MAVGYVASATSGSQASVATFNIGTLGTGARAGIVFVAIHNSATDIITGVTWNSAAMTLVGKATDTDTEPGVIKCYFLDNVTNGVITVSRTNNTVVTVGYAASISGTALQVFQYITRAAQTTNTGADTSAAGVAGTGGGLASVSDGNPGSDSMRFAASYTGAATPIAAGTGSTNLQLLDSTALGSRFVRETTAGQGARNVGFADSSDDWAAVYVAVREKTAVVAPGAAAISIAGATPTISNGALAIVHTCGAECAALAHWTTLTGGVTRSTVQQRSEAASIRVVTSGAQADALWTGSAITHKVLHFAIYLDGLPGSDAVLEYTLGTPDDAIVAYDSATGKLCVAEQSYWANRVLGPVISNQTWTTVDVHYDYSVGFPTISWQVNGVAQTPYTGPGGSAGHFDNVRIGQYVASGMPTNTTYTAYYDDVAVSETAADYPIGEGYTTSGEAWVKVTDTLVQPAAAAVSIAGATPTVVGQNYILLTPAAVAVTVGTATPAIATPVSIAPSAAAVTIAAATPALVAENWPLVQPAAAAVTVGTATPAVVGQNYILVQPAAVAVGIATATPAVGTPVSVQPAAAAATLAGATPAVALPVLVQPAAAAAAFSGATPALALPVSVQLGAAAVAITTATPGIVAQNWPKAEPAAAAVTIDGATPALVAQDWPLVQPAAAAVTVAGATPTVTALAVTLVQPAAAAVEVAGATAAILAVQTFTPEAAAVAVSGATPTVLADVQPAAVAVAIAGVAPAVNVTTGTAIQPDAAAVTVGTATPAILATQTFTPAAVAVSIAGVAPAVAAWRLVQPAAAAVTITGATPALSATQTYTPAAAAVAVTTATPAVSALAVTLAQPAAASATIATATPDVTTTANAAIQMAAASLMFAGMTPDVAATANVVIVPGPLGLTLTGATPDVVVPALLPGLAARMRIRDHADRGLATTGRYVPQIADGRRVP